jgi:DNA integrity scanning protein DisA with diadenylate cyclase activity/PKD repeat protein
MRQVHTRTSGFLLIVVVACIIILALPGVACAAVDNGTDATPALPPDGTSVPAAVPTVSQVTGNTSGIVPNITTVPVTPVPPVLVLWENVSGAVNPPPLLIFDPPVIYENLTCTVYGFVDPGSANVTIESVLWDWGDSQAPEYHGFPDSHTYSSPGVYTFSITAVQSDRQTVTQTTKISVGHPVIPETVPTPLVTPSPGGTSGPGFAIQPPVLTLLEPVVSGLNVTLNGNLNPGSPGVTIESVTVDWNDGNITRSADLPETHRYAAAGIFTVSVTAKQSDGQSATRKITLELRKNTSVPSGADSSAPPPNDLTTYIIIAMAIGGAVIVAVVLITRRSGNPVAGPGSPKPFPVRSGPLRDNRPSPEEQETICSGTGVVPDVLDSVIRVAQDIAREGREGQAIGTAFVVGDTQNVLNHSKQFVLNPFHGHQEAERRITDAGIQGTIKEFAQLDGAFLISGTGVVEAAGRCITVDMSRVDLPGGMGSRHLSIAAITAVTASIGIVVSQSGGQISVFKAGKIVYTIRS